ncbi:hypothetical protein QOZ91_001331 [Clostridium sardiniense]|nr:hypothetical protein [Clostridium sardiniense]
MEIESSQFVLKEELPLATPLFILNTFTNVYS